MPRRSRRRSSIDLWSWLKLVVILAVIAGFLTLIMEYPTAFAIGIVALVIVSFYVWGRYRTRRRLKAKTLGELLLLSPSGFESAVADLLHDIGYRDVRRIGGAGDLAADIVCKDKSGQSIVVQCKRYAPGARVGSPDIQAFIGMMSVHHRANMGLFVTTSGFTEPALKLAQMHGVTLIDGTELSRLVVSANGGEARDATEKQEPQ